MKISTFLSALLPVVGIALLGFRKLRGGWRVSREVAALQALRRPARASRKKAR